MRARTVDLVDLNDTVIALAFAAGKLTPDELAHVSAHRHRAGRSLDGHLRGGIRAMSISELRECIALGVHAGEARRELARRRPRERRARR